jgi:hypothetical protein
LYFFLSQVQKDERRRINATRAQQQEALKQLNTTTTDIDGEELSAEKRLQMRLKFLAAQAFTFAGGGTSVPQLYSNVDRESGSCSCQGLPPQ